MNVVFDWTRIELDAPLPDGSNSLKYDEALVKDIDPLSGELTLPGWDLSYQTDDLKEIIDAYQDISEDQLFYCRQRGMDEEEAVALVVNGFCKEVLQALPMEFAMEAQALVAISLEGSVG